VILAALRRYAGPGLYLGVTACLVLAGTGLAGCRGPAPESPVELRVLCDTALADVMEEIATAFQRRSDIRIAIESGESNALLDGLTADPESADLFVPFGDAYIEDAADLLLESETFAWTLPVLLVQRGNPREIAGVGDLSKPGLSLGLMTAPSSPLGRMLPGLLARHGLAYEDIAGNVTMEGGSAGELSNALRLGRIDATVLWHPTAVQVSRCEPISVGDAESSAVALAAGLSAAATDPESARTFMAFLTGAAARALLEAHHFAVERPADGGEAPADALDDGITETVF